MQTQTQPLSIRDRILTFDCALTAAEVAHLFSVEPDTIYKKARSGEIPSFRIGSSVRFDPKPLIDWLDRQ